MTQVCVCGEGRGGGCFYVCNSVYVRLHLYMHVHVQ